MTQAAQTANPNDARQASMSRVSTQETVLEKLNPPEPAKVAPEGKPEGEQDKDGEGKPKKGPSERIQELVAKRKEAEEKASEAERRAKDLEARVQALQAQAKPIEVTDARPNRSQYATQEEYEDAVGEWKAKQIIAKREQEQAQARAEAEQAEIAQQWSKRQEAVMKTIPDYAEVIGKTEVQVPDYIHQALLESEQGPQIAYFLALHPEEAKRIAGMKPVAAIKRVAALERDLAAIDAEDEKPAEKTPNVQKSKAPPPIEPVKSAASGSSSGTTDYESYRARRKAEQRK